jgi:hypothetical protein
LSSAHDGSNDVEVKLSVKREAVALGGLAAQLRLVAAYDAVAAIGSGAGWFGDLGRVPHRGLEWLRE